MTDSHSPEEIRYIEKTYGLELVDWQTVGGDFLYEYMENGKPRSVQQDAGMKIRIPVFRVKKDAPKPRESEWQKV